MYSEYSSKTIKITAHLKNMGRKVYEEKVLNNKNPIRHKQETYLIRGKISLYSFLPHPSENYVNPVVWFLASVVQVPCDNH